MKTAALWFAVSLVVGGSASAAERGGGWGEQTPGAGGSSGAGIFDQFVSASAPECVQRKALVDAGAKFVPLKEETFRFVQALYVAIPPLSKTLPRGDSAVLAIGPHNEVMVAIVDGDQTCARFLAPAFIVNMIGAVESGQKQESPPADSPNGKPPDDKDELHL